MCAFWTPSRDPANETASGRLLEQEPKKEEEEEEQEAAITMMVRIRIQIIAMIMIKTMMMTRLIIVVATDRNPTKYCSRRIACIK